VLDNGGNVAMPGAEQHQQYTIKSGGQVPRILAFSVTDGGKCGFSQLTFRSFRVLFLVSPSVRINVLLTSHSTSEVQLNSTTDRARHTRVMVHTVT